MAGEAVEIAVIYNILPELAAALEKAAAQVVAQTAKELAAAAAAQAPVATGFLQSSLYTVTKDGSTYGQGATTPPKDSYLLPEVDRPTKPTEAIVAVGANYGVYVEMGTRFMPSQSFLTPAAEAARVAFVAEMADLEAKMKTAGVGAGSGGSGG